MTSGDKSSQLSSYLQYFGTLLTLKRAGGEVSLRKGEALVFYAFEYYQKSSLS